MDPKDINDDLKQESKTIKIFWLNKMTSKYNREIRREIILRK